MYAVSHRDCLNHPKAGDSNSVHQCKQAVLPLSLLSPSTALCSICKHLKAVYLSALMLIWGWGGESLVAFKWEKSVCACVLWPVWPRMCVPVCLHQRGSWLWDEELTVGGQMICLISSVKVPWFKEQTDESTQRKMDFISYYCSESWER